MLIDKLMKGHTFAKGKKKLTYPAFAEVKVDEIRLDVRLNAAEGLVFRSFADKPLHNLTPFGSKFINAMQAGDIQRLDMGVLVNKNFNDTYRYVRSSKGLGADLAGLPVEFILFDVPDHGQRPFAERRKLRTRVANWLIDYGLPVYLPMGSVVQSEDEVLNLYGKVIAGGYEGLMVKSYDHTYEPGKRTNGWLKVKPEEDADGVVWGITEAVSEAGEPLGRVGSLRVTAHLPDGSTQEVSVPGIPHEIGKAWFLDPSLILGQWIEFQYMMRDRQGGFRHPRFGRIREAKA